MPCTVKRLTLPFFVFKLNLIVFVHLIQISEKVHSIFKSYFGNLTLNTYAYLMILPF